MLWASGTAAGWAVCQKEAWQAEELWECKGITWSKQSSLGNTDLPIKPEPRGQYFRHTFWISFTPRSMKSIFQSWLSGKNSISKWEGITFSQVRDATVLLLSVASFPSTARFSVVAFQHYSPPSSSLYLVGMNTALLPPVQEQTQKPEAEKKQNQILQKNVAISAFARSQLTGVKCYNLSLQTDVSAKPQKSVNCPDRKTKPKPSQSCWYPSLNTEK